MFFFKQKFIYLYIYKKITSNDIWINFSWSDRYILNGKFIRYKFWEKCKVSNKCELLKINYVKYELKINKWKNFEIYKKENYKKYDF